MMTIRQLFGVCVLCLTASTGVATASPVVSGGMVATVHPLATDAGVEAMRRGGNAVDAAIAAALTLGVVDSHNSGLGGGCFILLRLSDGRLAAIDGRETAPGRATRDMFLRDGRPEPELSQIGALAAGVPGALAAYALASEKYGEFSLADLLLPAALIAEHGFVVDRVMAERLHEHSESLARFESTRAAFFTSENKPYCEGQLLRQPDLAASYRAIAEHGPDWFYLGPFARHTGAWMNDNGGILQASDFARYRAREREPIVTAYRGYTIIGFPPPSSGGIHVAQILNILEQFDLKSLHQHAPGQFTHVVAEAMKLAFADRAHWLGDADFANVPRGLIDKRYAAVLARRIDRESVARVSGHGSPPNWQHDIFGKHTTHIAAADGNGNWAAITATINTSFGSKVVVPGTGVLLNNEMDDFSIAPGVPNAFGLIGAESNSVAPGKRPLSSMSPTIVLKDGAPVMTLGAAGGPTIITQTVMAIVRCLDLGMSLDEALAAPRFHHQWSPDQLFVESSLAPSMRKDLERRGHTLQEVTAIATVQAIARGADGTSLLGVHDPRVPGKALGF